MTRRTLCAVEQKLFWNVMCYASFAKTNTKNKQPKTKQRKQQQEQTPFFFFTFSFSLLQPIEESSTDLAKQKEIEREKEELMDEGDFLEYKVNEEEFSKTCCKSRRSH